MKKINFYRDKKEYLAIILITTIGVFLRFYGFSSQGYWMDEDFTFFLATPNQSYFELLEKLDYEHRVVGNPNVPAIYYYVLSKFFLMFGYNPENGRILSVIFGSLSIPICYLIVNLWTKNKLLSIYSSIFISLNLFLIWESQETRPQSMVVFFSMLSIFFFSKNFFNHKSLVNNILTVATNFFLLSLHPVTFAIVFSQFFFLIYKIYFNKINYNRLLLCVIISILFYFLFNFKYLFYQISIPYNHFSSLTKSFFYSYHFKTFFGSIYFGILNLILISFILLTNINHLKKNDIIIFFSLIIFFAYTSTVVISILKTGLMHPRYKIYCVPLILMWITISIGFYKNYKKYLILLFIITLFNTIIFIDDRHLKKPPTQQVLKIIVSTNEKNVFTHAVHWKSRFDNTFKNYLIFKQNKLNLINNTEELKKKDGFWLVCSNKMRSITIFNNDAPDIKCDLNLKNYKLTSQFKLDDFILSRFHK